MAVSGLGGGLIKRSLGKGKDKPPKRAFDVAINITPMTDFMASILCFLLVSATYVQLAKLDANLPTTGSAAAAEASTLEDEDEKLQLQILLTKSRAIKIDRGQGLEDLAPTSEGKYDWMKLDEVLKAVLVAFPAQSDAILSADPDVEYESVIAAMDICVANKLPNVSLAAAAAKGAE